MILFGKARHYCKKCNNEIVPTKVISKHETYHVRDETIDVVAKVCVFDILPTAKAGGFCGQTAIAAEGSLTSPSARENALSL